MSTRICIKFIVRNVWYDTIDQPVIPVNLVNECQEDVSINIEIKSLEGKRIHSEKIKLRPSEKRSLEITLPYYGDVVLTAVGKLEKTGTTIELGEHKLKL